MKGDIQRFFADRAWRENKAAVWAAVGVSVFLTSFFWAPTRDFMHGVYAVAFFVPVLLVLLLRAPHFREYGGWFTALGLLYAGFAALSTLWSSEPRPGFFLLHFVFLAVWLCGTAWLAGRGQLDLSRICRVLVCTGAVASVIYQVLFHLHSYPLGYATELGLRLGSFHWGVARNPNTIGLIFGAMTLLAYTGWLDARGPRQGAIRFGLLLLNIMPILASQSRGPLLALAFTLALAFGLHRGPSRKWLIHGVLALAVVGGFAVATQGGEGIWQRVSVRFQQPSYRPQIWQYLIAETAEQHPILGRGLVKTTRIHVPGLEKRLPFTHHAHNAYIDALYWTGIIGLVLMLAHLGYTMWHWSNSPLLLPVFLWLLFGCLTALVDRPGFFEHLNAHWFAYWIPAGLIAAAVSAGGGRAASG